MAQADGMGQLLAAEDEAKEIVRLARDARAERLRQAEADAQKAMEEEKARLERELSREDPGDANVDPLNKELDDKTKAEVANINAAFAKNKDNVLALLLYQVTQVKLECTEAMKQAVLTKDREAQAEQAAAAGAKPK